MAKPRRSGWTLARYRRPLEDVPKPRSKERAQLQQVLDQEWACTIAEAKRDEEIDVEAVDVVDTDGEVRYQLYLWPFGSGVAFVAGTTTAAAEIIQHTITGDDAREIAGAIAADARRLKLAEAKPPSVGTRAPAPKAEPAASLAEALAKGAELAAQPVYHSVLYQLFAPWLASLHRGPTTEWSPFPKHLPGELTAEQRTILERVIAWDNVGDYTASGLFARKEHYQRFLGLVPPGPSDTPIALAGREVPAWWAISCAASGHATPADVLAALGTLSAEQRRAIFDEVVRGDAYDLLRPQHTRRKDAGISRTPPRLKYWTTLFQLLADLAHSLGAGARAAADALLADLPEYQFGGAVEPHPRTPRMAVALLVRARLDSPLDEALDAQIAELAAYGRRDEIFFSKHQLDRILAAVPPARRAALEPTLIDAKPGPFNWKN